ncbi:MAG: DUF4398 domain-containing protein [Treponema sp.]|nr:DUF4398 domain-containing protein [Treponema sp.]
MKMIKIACAILVCALLVAGCAKPPKADMDAATEAVTKAESDSDAALYAANSVARARDALNRMQTEANSKRYDAAKTYAAEAITAAQKALADGQAGAIQARNDATTLINGLRPAIAETEQGLNTARSAKLALDFTALTGSLEQVKLNADQAEAALAANQYQQAMDKGRSVQAGLSDINNKLSGAVMATSRKK